MSCQCCCTKTLNLCSADICGNEINFNILAQSSGVHKMVTDFLGMPITIEKDFLAGDDVIFPIEGLNEDYEYTVQLFDTSNDKIVIRKDEVDYDCFKFKTTINVLSVSVGS